MPFSIKAFMALAFLAVVAACGNNGTTDDVVVVDPVPMSQEPVFTGKYGS